MESNSLFIYHNVGPVVTGISRSLSLPVSQYIDDRHEGQLFLSGLAVCQPSRQLAQAGFILVFLLISAGYFINLAKSSPQPSTFVKFLCFISDSVLQAFFIVPLDKKGKSKTLREELLGSSFAPVLELESVSQEKHYQLVLQSRLLGGMYGRCSNLSALLPRIRRFLFQFKDLCDRNFGNGLSWTTGLVTYLGTRNIVSLSQCSATSPRWPREQSW